MSPPDPPPKSPRERAEDLFVSALASRDRGNKVALERLLEDHPDLSGELRRLLKESAEADGICDELKAASYLASLGGPPSDRDDPEWRELMERLSTKAPLESRYQLLSEVAQGGMGVVFKVWDQELDRPLAMKVALEEDDPDCQKPTHVSASLGRFLEEAQMTGQLDHPGIVPVHELGVDEKQRVYFTMRLVEGRSLRDVIRMVHGGNESGWTQTRVLGVLLKVCEAVAYAHSKGVLHRDLKPSNVMVGRFGEVYTMDWGLAKALRASPRAPNASPPRETETDSEDPGAAQHTRQGTVLGTPAYMAPEQARGEVDRLDSRTDVYSIGAMLYHLLAGCAPYADREESPTARQIIQWVTEGSPTRLGQRNPTVAPELEAVCERAMARAPEHRYQSVESLATDLRSYLEQRVVRAYETGPLAELRKWVLRNRATAGSLAAAILITITLLTLMFTNEAQNARALSRSNRELESAHQEVRHYNDRFTSLADINELRRLEQASQELWPVHPELVPAMERWIQDAEKLAATLPAHRAFAQQLATTDATAEAGGQEWSRARWLPDLAQDLVAGLEQFLADDPGRGTLADVRRRLERSRTIQQRSVDAFQDRWEEAIDEVFLSEAYDGFEFSPQVGLIPLGPDPDSGLWEFLVLDSGDEPTRHPDTDQIVLGADSGVVLVLVPAGSFQMGTQHTDPNAPQYEPQPYDSSPSHPVELAPFFVAKFELTQGQWERVMGDRPAQFNHLAEANDWARRPVEQVSYHRAEQCLKQLGLQLPTEAQWEYAARAGTRTRWWCGENPASVATSRAGNVHDAASQRARPDDAWGDPEPWDDGHAIPAPVGSFAANPFGLHDVIGNVIEWCRDWHGSYQYPVRDGDGLREVPVEEQRARTYRGGSFDFRSGIARSAYREFNTPETASYNLGVRPTRPVHSSEGLQR